MLVFCQVIVLASVVGIGTLARVTFGGIPCLSVKVASTDLFRLIFARHFSYHSDK